jgi:uncharacterized protein (TIGR02391 family)
MSLGVPGSRRVTLIKHAGTAAEERREVHGNIQAKKGFFDVTTPIDIGDIVEEPDPREGFDFIRRSVRVVDIHGGRGPLSHIEVTWGDAPAPPREKPRILVLGELHPLIVEAAGAIYRDGYLASAVFEAFKAVDVRMRQEANIDEVGVRLIGAVFGGANPRLRLTRRGGKLGEDEHEGRRLMLMGAFQGIRNLGAHELEGVAPASAIELLGLTSQFMRWLDDLPS